MDRLAALNELERKDMAALLNAWEEQAEWWRKRWTESYPCAAVEQAEREIRRIKAEIARSGT